MIGYTEQDERNDNSGRTWPSTPTGSGEGLIARLEAAEVGSRELDGDIHRVLFPDDLIMTDSGSVGPVKREAVRKPVKEVPQVPGDVIADCMGVTFYTTSLDAALALAERVLPGWVWNMGNDLPCWVHLWIDDRNYDGNPIKGDAATGPLAMCAAILRATGASS